MCLCKKSLLECVRKIENVCLCLIVMERDRQCVCVWMSEREREREREREKKKILFVLGKSVSLICCHCSLFAHPDSFFDTNLLFLPFAGEQPFFGAARSVESTLLDLFSALITILPAHLKRCAAFI